MEGSLSEPVAHTSTGARYSSPPAARTTQRPAASSQRASSTALAEAQVPADLEAVDAGAHVVPDLALGRERAGPVRVEREGERVQVRGDVAAAPGYELSRQVPPRSLPRSRTTKSSMPMSRRRAAIPMPEKPAPTTTTLVLARSRGRRRRSRPPPRPAPRRSPPGGSGRRRRSSCAAGPSRPAMRSFRVRSAPLVMGSLSLKAQRKGRSKAARPTQAATLASWAGSSGRDGTSMGNCRAPAL